VPPYYTGEAVKLITKPLIKENKIDSLALFRAKFSEGIMEAHTKRGYAITLFVSLTHIPVPVRNKTFEKMLQINKSIKEENEAKIKDTERLDTVEIVLNDVDSSIKAGKEKTQLHTIREKLVAASDLMHQFFPRHKSLAQRADGIRVRLWKVVEIVFKNIGGGGSAESGLPSSL